MTTDPKGLQGCKRCLSKDLMKIPELEPLYLTTTVINLVRFPLQVRGEHGEGQD